MPDLDELLRADGATWRGEIDALGQPAPDGLVAIGRSARHVRWRAPLAAALVTLLLATTIGYYAIRDGSAGRSLPALPVLPTAGLRVDPLKPVPASQVAYARRYARPVHRTEALSGGEIHSMHWTFLALLDGGRTVLVGYTIGDSCARSLGFRVQQGSNAVELTALSRVVPGSCEQFLAAGFGVIHLDRPLGSRLLLHGRVQH